MKINYQQHKTIQVLFTKANMMHLKADIVLGFTNGRSESRKDLTYQEANEIIAYLQGFTNNDVNEREKASNTMRRKILAMCHCIQWETEKGKVDMNRLDEWCKTKSSLLKPLMQYTYEELPALVTQFRQVYKYYLNRVNA